MSCQSYSGLSNGWYKIITKDDNKVKVYCHFESDRIWTLVMSYSLKFNQHYKNTPYFTNSPRNEMIETWEDHRLSLNSMKTIKEDGNTLWCITCSYGNKGWNTTDIVIAKHKNAPIMKKDMPFPMCLNVDFINIRGNFCRNCSVPFWQRKGLIFHIDSENSKNYCEKKRIFDPMKCDEGSGGENNFGFYNCQNRQHRCSSSNNATTQLWFGGKIK